MQYNIGVLNDLKHYQLTLDKLDFMQLCDSDSAIPVVGRCLDVTLLLYPGFSMPKQFDRLSGGYGVNAYGAYFGMPLDVLSIEENFELIFDGKMKKLDDEFKQRINSSRPIPIRFNGLPDVDLAYVTVRVEK